MLWDRTNSILLCSRFLIMLLVGTPHKDLSAWITLLATLIHSAVNSCTAASLIPKQGKLSENCLQNLFSK